jgi:hypothetical protein
VASREIGSDLEIDFASAPARGEREDIDVEAIHAAVAALPARQQQVIKGLKFEDRSVREVASRLNMSESAVKVTAHRGYRALRRLLVLSVPGAERSMAQRVVPFVALGAWAALLGTLLIAGGNPVARVIAFPVNWPCGYKILGFSLIPGFALFAMLRRAAPLEPAWNASLAALAATAVGAAATQFICPVDDPAHQIVGHVLPLVVLAAVGTIAGYRSLERKNRF